MGKTLLGLIGREHYFDGLLDSPDLFGGQFVLFWNHLSLVKNFYAFLEPQSARHVPGGMLI